MDVAGSSSGAGQGGKDGRSSHSSLEEMPIQTPAYDHWLGRHAVAHHMDSSHRWAS